MKLDYLIDTNIFISLFNQELTQPVPNGNIGYSVIKGTGNREQGTVPPRTDNLQDEHRPYASILFSTL